MVRSLAFGSKIRYISFLHNRFLCAFFLHWGNKTVLRFAYLNGGVLLASNINLLTHYAKGTLLFLIKNYLKLLIKLLLNEFPHGTIHYRLLPILSFRGRNPFIQTEIPFYLKAFLPLFTLFVESRLIYFPKTTKIFQFILFI